MQTLMYKHQTFIILYQLFLICIFLLILENFLDTKRFLKASVFCYGESIITGLVVGLIGSWIIHMDQLSLDILLWADGILLIVSHLIAWALWLSAKEQFILSYLAIGAVGGLPIFLFFYQYT